MSNMPSTVRLSPTEQELIRKKCVEINKLLVKNGMEPVKDSEFVHKMLEKSVPYATIGKDGEIVLDID